MRRGTRGQAILRLTHPKPLVLIILYSILFVTCGIALVLICAGFSGRAARTTVSALTTVYLNVPSANCTCSAAEEAARLGEVEDFLRSLQNTSSNFVNIVYTEAAGDFVTVDCQVDHDNETVSTWRAPRATATLRCSIAENREQRTSVIMERIEIDTDVYRHLDGYRTQDGVLHRSNTLALYLRIAGAACAFVVVSFAVGVGVAQYVHYRRLCRMRRPPSRGCRTIQQAVAVLPTWQAGRRVFPEYEMHEAPYGRGYYVEPPTTQVPAAAEAGSREPIRRGDDSEGPTRTVSQLSHTNDSTEPLHSSADNVKKHERFTMVTAEEIANALEDDEDSSRYDRSARGGRAVLPPVLSADFIDIDAYSDEATNQPGITLEATDVDGTTRRLLTQEMLALRAAHRHSAKIVYAVAVAFAFASAVLPIVSAVVVIATSVTGASETATLQTANHLIASHGVFTIAGCVLSGITVATIILILSRGLF